MKRVTVENYKEDKYYRGVVAAVATILESRNFVAPVDVFIQMEFLTHQQLEDWRRGRIPYLERAVSCNLSKASRILRLLRLHAHDLNLKPSQTVYKKWGKGRSRTLRFSKSGKADLEAAYSRHFVQPSAKRQAADRGHASERV